MVLTQNLKQTQSFKPTPNRDKTLINTQLQLVKHCDHHINKKIWHKIIDLDLK